MEEFQDRLMFGTDLDFPGQEIPQLEYIKQLKDDRRISKKTFDKIMRENASRILRLSSH